jgi:SAM-dependent methyltransferase
MGLKEIGKSFVGRTAKYPAAFAIYKFSGRIAQSLGQIYGHAHHTLEIGERDERLRKLTLELFPDLIVAGGPFAGMRWIVQPFGSALLPKLLGSYESELHPALEEAFRENYDTVVDIGCGEGYYAAGMARRLPRAAVYAFDTNPHARRLCNEVVKLNGLEERVHVGDSCDAGVLSSLPLGEKALIISDCEGYERFLFNRNLAALLAKHDLIVEVHDFIDIETSAKLRDAFFDTHQIRSIKSVDDIQKAHTYQYPRLDKYDIQTKWLILSERRPGIMEWFVLKSKIGRRDLVAC